MYTSGLQAARRVCQMARPRPPDDDEPFWLDGPDCFGRGHPLIRALGTKQNSRMMFSRKKSPTR